MVVPLPLLPQEVEHYLCRRALKAWSQTNREAREQARDRLAWLKEIWLRQDAVGRKILEETICR
jgi:hypothetical protein